MTKPANPSITKTCAVCGLVKPLSAFLQLTGDKGTTYGNTCSTCRKTSPDALAKTESSEGSTSVDSNHSVSSKTKVRGEADKRQLNKDTHEQYHEDRKITQEILDKKLDRQAVNTKTEQAIKRSFLDRRAVKPIDKKAATNNKITEQRQKADVTTEQARLKETVTKEAEALKTVDFTAPYIPSQTGPLLKHGVAFKSFLKWVGTGSPVANQTQEAAKRIAQEGKITVKELEKKTTAEIVEDYQQRPGSKKR